MSPSYFFFFFALVSQFLKVTYISTKREPSVCQDCVRVCLQCMLHRVCVLSSGLLVFMEPPYYPERKRARMRGRERAGVRTALIYTCLHRDMQRYTVWLEQSHQSLPPS